MRCLHESGWTGALAGPRRHAPDLGLPGTTGALPALRVSSGGAVLDGRDPGPGRVATASIAYRGGTTAARREQRWGFAGRREKQEAGLTPDRAGWPGQADGAPHIWPVIKKGGLYPQEQKRRTPAGQSRTFPPSSRGAIPRSRQTQTRRRGGRYPRQHVRIMSRQAEESYTPPSGGGLNQEEDKRHTPA